MSHWLYGATEAAMAYLKPQPRPHHDLLNYAKVAVLPKMDLAPGTPSIPLPNDNSNHNKLWATHEKYRNLEEMYLIMEFRDTVNSFCSHNVPSTPLGDSDDDPVTGTRIAIPASGYGIPYWSPGNPANLERIMHWMLFIPLTTVSRMLHLVYPETAHYQMQTYTKMDERDQNVIGCIKWGPNEMNIMDAGDLYKPTVAIFVQPPWMLTQTDLERFAATPVFPSPHVRHKLPLSSPQRLWAKIWEICLHTRSHFFVLTSYWGWVFGAFSAERTKAWTSEVIPWDSQSPTVLECLFFWIACATVQEQDPVGAWTIPKVYEPIGIDEDTDSTPEQTPRMLPSELSASDDWDARSDARSHTPSANASEDSNGGTVVLYLTGGQSSDEPLKEAEPSLWRSRSTTNEWQLGVRSLVPPRRGLMRPPSPTQSQLTNWSNSTVSSASSVSTVRDYSSDNRQSGAFVAGNARTHFLPARTN